MPIPILYALFLLFSRLYAVIARGLKNPETRGGVYAVLVLIAAGTSFYHFAEDLRWIDAFYFTVITLTTIGYGDFTPQTDAGKLFTVGYSLVGLAAIGGFIALIATQQQERATRWRGSNQESTDEGEQRADHKGVL